MRVHIGNRGNSPYILNHGARWWYVVSFTLRPKYACGTIVLSDSRLRNLVTDAPMPPFPHTSSCRSTKLRLQTVPGSGIGPETVYRELRQA